MKITHSLKKHMDFLKIDCILGHKANLYKFKQTEFIHYVPFDYNTIKLKISNLYLSINIDTHGD